MSRAFKGAPFDPLSLDNWPPLLQSSNMSVRTNNHVFFQTNYRCHNENKLSGPH